MKTSDLILEANSLPIEERAKLIDSLMRSLNAPDSEFEREWIALAEKRRDELASGAVKPVPGEEVFERIRERFSRER